MPNTAFSSQRPVAIYRYESDTGLLLFQKRRYSSKDEGAKDFRYCYSDGIHLVWKLPRGMESYIYNLPRTLKAVSNEEDIYWTEGEKDADALTALGLPATSHHQGAPNPHPLQAQWFQGHLGRVFLVLDRDYPGALDAYRRYKYLRAVGVRPEQLVLVRSAVLKKGADAFDHLAAGFTVEEFVSVSAEQVVEWASRCTTKKIRGRGYRG
jgi:hypothetical protein